MNKTEELLTTEEVGALLKIPIATIRWWRHVGKGPKGFTVGRHVRYRSADVQAWIDRQVKA